MLNPTLRKLPLTQIAMFAVAVAVGTGLAFERFSRLVIVLALGVAVVAIGLMKPRPLVVAVFVFLPFLGFVRRVLSSGYGGTTNDLLLLVVPLATAILMLSVLSRPAEARSRHANAVLLLMVLTLLSVLNPLQGGLAVGLAGLLFMFVPMLWFWIGRSLVDEGLLHRLLVAVVPLALLASLYGLSQIFFGFLSFDQNWIDTAGYVALNVGGVIRPFGTFNSAAEYATYIAIGLIAVWALAKTVRGRLFTLPVFLVIATALFLEAQRGILIMTIASLTVMMAVRHKVGLGRAGIFGLAAILMVSYGFRFVAFSTEDVRFVALLEHQVAGISNPFDEEDSTLIVHAKLFFTGVLEAFKNPVGRGAGSVSRASSKFGGTGSNTEVDLSNAAVALGLPGLLAFLYVWVTGLKRAYRWARVQQDPKSLLLLGILILTSFQWLNGGQYAIAPFAWLILGFLDRNISQNESESTSTEETDDLAGLGAVAV